jgi:hypothetical protein
MGLKSQYQVKIKQAKKRKKARAKLTREGLNLNDYYYNKFYLK